MFSSDSAHCVHSSPSLLVAINQHDLNVTSTLTDLEPYTKVVELKAGESLFHYADGTLDETRERGLYFIEHGMMVSTFLSHFN